LLADLRQENAEVAAKIMGDAGFDVSTAIVDVSSRASVEALVQKAASIGEVLSLIQAAGVSPTQASPTTILKVDLYGTALLLEEFGNVIARGGAGIVIASQSGHRLPALPPDQNRALATTPADDGMALNSLCLQIRGTTDSASTIRKTDRQLRLVARLSHILKGQSPHVVQLPQP
jgi:hypothetical protein